MSIPGGLSTITVAIDFTGMAGAADSGTVSFAPPVDVLFPGAAVLSRTPQVATLSGGVASIVLVTTDNASLNPNSWGYTVTISLTGLNFTYAYTGVGIPSTYGASVNLATVLPPSVPTPITPNTFGVLAQPNTWLGANTFDGTVVFAGAVVGNGVTDWVNVKAYGATGNGTTDDTSAITAALNAAGAAGGGIVFLPWGTYLTSGPLSIPPAVRLVGETAVSLNLGSLPGTLSRIIASGSWAPATPTGMIVIASKTPGGWPVTAQSSAVENLMLDGSANSNTNLNGIYLNGPVYDVHLKDVFVYKAPHNGIHAAGVTESGVPATFPYHQRYEHVTCANSGNVGFNIVNFTDSLFEGCLAFGSGGNGWTLQNNSNAQLIGCRGEWSTGTGRGFDITGSSGSIVLHGCMTDQNAAEGIRIHAATGQSTQGGGIVITGGKLHADGSGGGNPTGLKITGSSVPITITGMNIESGQNGSSWWPTTGIEIDTSSNITVNGCIVQGITTPWSDGGGNAYVVRKGCLGLTGDPSSQITSVLADLPASNTPLPDDYGYLAWTFDPALQASSTAPTAGVVYLTRITVRTTMTITNLIVGVATAGSGLTATENIAGLYDDTGTLLSATADQSTAWAATGRIVMPLTSAKTVSPGIYFIGFVANGSTPPALLRGTVTLSAVVNNGSPAGPNARYMTSGTGQTTLPSSITLTSAALSATAWWGAVT